MIFERYFLNVSFLRKVVECIFVESFDAVNFGIELIEVVSSQNFSHKDRTELLVEQCELVQLFEKSFNHHGLISF